MLAYVFWHQRSRKVAKEEYQEKLNAFHQVLPEQRSPGFQCSLVLEMAHLPWMVGEGEAYEDWYLVENSAALDPLDSAAVTGICREPHNQVARLADNGTGGLYRLKSGIVDPAQLATIHVATWFNKPVGMSYARLYELLQECQIEQQGLLWQRQMTMGPAREFCLHSSQMGLLPKEIERVQVAAQPIFVPAR
jgi:hypothetical protein